MSNEKKVAVIGVGNIGSAVATNLVKGNRPVIVASRKLTDAQNLAGKLGNLATATEVPDALKQADIVVLAIMYDGVGDFLTEHAADLEGKEIIDPSNPISVDDKGNFSKSIPKDQSAGEINAHRIPKGATIAKAMGTWGAPILASASFQQPNPAIMFYATDDTNINSDIEKVITDSGFVPIRVGGMDQSIRIEVFGDLAGLANSTGPSLSIAEAESKI